MAINFTIKPLNPKRSSKRMNKSKIISEKKKKVIPNLTFAEIVGLYWGAFILSF